MESIKRLKQKLDELGIENELMETIAYGRNWDDERYHKCWLKLWKHEETLRPAGRQFDVSLEISQDILRDEADTLTIEYDKYLLDGVFPKAETYENALQRITSTCNERDAIYEFCKRILAYQDDYDE